MIEDSIYIIGDVHGCYNTLCSLIEQLPDKYDSKICFVGDLIDRGPNSKQVIDLVKKHDYDCILGNHEKLCIDFDGNPYNSSGGWGYNNNGLNDFGGNGGVKTLDSYGNFNLLQDDIDCFFSKLEPYKIYDIKNKDGKKLLISHSSASGYLEEDKLENKEYRDNLDDGIVEMLTWNRDLMYERNSQEKLKILPFKNYFNVFGHTIVKEPIINERYAAIDTGAFTKDGYLTALEYPSMRVFKQKNIDDI